MNVAAVQHIAPTFDEKHNEAQSTRQRNKRKNKLNIHFVTQIRRLKIR